MKRCCFGIKPICIRLVSLVIKRNPSNHSCPFKPPFTCSLNKLLETSWQLKLNSKFQKRCTFSIAVSLDCRCLRPSDQQAVWPTVCARLMLFQPHRTHLVNPSHLWFNLLEDWEPLWFKRGNWVTSPTFCKFGHVCGSPTSCRPVRYHLKAILRKTAQASLK